MAVVSVKTAGGWQVTFDGAAEWDITSATLEGITTDSRTRDRGVRIQSLEVTPAATDDKLIIREGGATGRIIMNFLAADKYDEKIKYFNDINGGKYYKLYVAAAEVTSGIILLIET